MTVPFVSGTYTYPDLGSHSVCVDLFDVYGNFATTGGTTVDVTDGALQATPASIALDELTAGNVVKVAHGWCPISALLGTIFQEYRHWSTGRSLESIERRRQQCVFLQKKAALQLHAADLASDYVYEADANGSATERKAWQSAA